MSIALLSVATRAQEAPSPSGSVDFVRDIQPVFEKSCYNCHGAKTQMGGLRLDASHLAAKSIRSGKASESPLYQRIAGIGEQARMPMGGKPLPPEQIELIRKWIDEGARWPEAASARSAEIPKHWAWVAPVRPAVPAIANTRWIRNPIDAFVLARLNKEGLAPSAEADRVTLLRRLSLDLIGLPPEPADVDAFVRDNSPNAYEKQVERLLASPHYGERWGRHWLDAARYADSDGFEKDKQRSVWFYRDWVINALNRNLPYDQFIVEQLAGDLLPNPAQAQIVATGFLRNSMNNEEGGIDPEQFRMEAMFDRIDAIGKSMLGITIQCAQCHNHKYDPLTQEEYYRLFAFLNNSNEANIAVYTPAEQQKRAEIFRRTREIESELQHRLPGWQKRMAEWEEKARDERTAWTVLKPEIDDISASGQKFYSLEDGSLLAQGYAPLGVRLKLKVKAEHEVSAFRLELLTDPNLPLGGPGRSAKGVGILSEFEVEAGKKKLKLVSASGDFNAAERPLDPLGAALKRLRVTGPVSYAIDGKDETAWTTDAGPGRRNRSMKAVFVLAEPVPAGTELYVYLSQKHGGLKAGEFQNNNLGRFRLSVTAANEAVADPLPADVRAVLTIPVEKRTPSQKHAVFRYWRTTVDEWKTANQEIEKIWEQYPEGTPQLVLSERDTMRPTHILTRGDFLKPAKQVAPGTPAFLHPLNDARPDRLSFARWIVDRKAPTTARSMINRIWQAYFGNGIITTAEDFGKQSEPPSHPELLDWLAVEFMDRGWDVKHMHRLIVTSATYRQSSRVAPDLLKADPYNRLLARGPRVRVEAEIVRDIALAASGLLNPKIGGPSVFPPAPDFLFVPPASYTTKLWVEDKDEDRYRRALYTFRYRSVPYPMLQTFDAPNGDMSCVRRARSNTPLQALTTLNEPLFVEAAQALAARTLREGGATDTARLEYMFRRCVARKPSPLEADELLGLLDSERKRLAEGWVSAREVAGITDPRKVPAGATPVQSAAWTVLARVLLNLDETITKE